MVGLSDGQRNNSVTEAVGRFQRDGARAVGDGGFTVYERV